MNKKTIWLLSAYRSDSHASWADWLLKQSDTINWHKLELPGRHFRWRIRGNPLSWFHQLPEGIPDLILATSMVDIATIKGLHPQLANVPCIYYFHENQFAYPLSKHQVNSIEPMMVQLYGALASEQLVFNSTYNRNTFLEGVEQLLVKFPDQIPHSIPDLLRNKCQVLPVPIIPIKTNQAKNKILILWNHRWEYDKAPQVFFEALSHLKKSNADFELALLGNRSKIKPAILIEIEEKFADRISINKMASRQDYEQVLSQAAVVVSTAIHEFQGLSMLEAVSAGAVPLAPDSLCYPEQYEPCYQYSSGDSQQLAEKINNNLQSALEAPDVSKYYEQNLLQDWLRLLHSS